LNWRQVIFRKPGVYRSLTQVSKRIPWLLLAILTLAAFLRFLHLGSESLWLDEALSANRITGDLATIAQTTAAEDVHPPFYFFVLYLWTLLFGQSEVALRSLSACLGVASVFMVYKLGLELFNRRTALIASFLMTISAFAIAYSQETRHYSLLLLLTLISFFFFTKILKAEKASKANLLFYTLTNILLAYTHIFGIFIILAQVFYFILFRRRYSKAWLKFWAAQAITFLFFLPWIVVLITVTFQGVVGTLDWIPEPSFTQVAQSIASLMGAGYLPRAVGILFVLVILFLCLAGVIYVSQGQQQGKSVSRLQNTKLKGLVASILEPRTAMVLVWFFFPIIITLILSLAVRPLFVSRYLIGVIPVFSLLAAQCINNIGSLVNTRAIRANIAALTLISLIVLITLPGLYDYYSHTQKDQWREATKLIQELEEPGDAIVFNRAYFLIPFDYYYQGAQEITVVRQEAIENDEPFEGVERLWLVIRSSESTKDEPLRQALVERYGSNSLMLEEDFYGVTVYLFDLNTEENDSEQKCYLLGEKFGRATVAWTKPHTYNTFLLLLAPWK
jgi:4-amino-4-deoxy-L-arabinose transferase-like glycosyltransferase